MRGIWRKFLVRKIKLGHRMSRGHPMSWLIGLISLIGFISLMGLTGLWIPAFAGMTGWAGMTNIAHAATATSTSFKSADSEAVMFGGLATSTSFRNVGAGQAVLGTAASASFKGEIGILYFEPPAVPTPEVPPAAGGGGTLFLEEEETEEERLLRRSTEAELLAMTRMEAEGLLRSLRELAMTKIESLRGVAEAIPKKIKEIFFPPPKPELLPIEGVVLAVPPYALSGQWILLPARAIREFALAPLPRDIRMLTQKFPEVGRTLSEIGVRKITDVEKMRDVTLELPGLSEAAGVVTPSLRAPSLSRGEAIFGEDGEIATVAVGDLAMTPRFALPTRVPLAELSLEYKRRIPAEFVFVRAGGELIDMKTVLSLNEKGEAEQRVFVVAGKVLHLSVKPKGDVKSVKGYLVYKGESKVPRRQPAEQLGRGRDYLPPLTPPYEGGGIAGIEAKDLVASALFAGPGASVIANEVKQSMPPREIAAGATRPRNDNRNSVIARRDDGGVIARAEPEAISVSTELVIAEFEYADPDGDGIWTAEVQAPVVEGEYETITLIDYIDPEKGRQAVRLITVVDPEGYVFEWDGDRQTRVAGAIISLYWLNPATSEYELWQAEKYLQKNPQVTDVTGKYAFLTPEGTYYLKVEAPGYLAYEGKPFVVEEGRGIHFNIDMRTAAWWLKMIDWKWITMLLLFLLVAYNYYRDVRVKQWTRR